MLRLTDCSRLERLLQDGVNIEAYGGRASSTALQVACVRNHPAAVEVLLEAGADPNSKNMNGVSNLASARLNGLANIEKLLLKYGATHNEVRSFPADAHRCPKMPTLWVCCSGHLNDSALSPDRCSHCDHCRCLACSELGTQLVYSKPLRPCKNSFEWVFHTNLPVGK